MKAFTMIFSIVWLAVAVFPLQASVPGGADRKKSRQIESEILRISKGYDATVGVAVIAEGGKVTAYVNDGQQYPLMSVMKLHQALCVTDSLSRAGLPLDILIDVYGDDLKRDTYSPLRDSLLRNEGNTGGKTAAHYKLSVKTLLKYTLQLSDNNACDILFRHFGGPPATGRYIRSLGIDGFEIRVTEDQMHKDLSLCRDNWSTPSSAAELLWKMAVAFTGQDPADDAGTARLRENEYLDFVCRTMISCSTGRDRLVAPLPGCGVQVAHKTGTGDRDSSGRIIAINDIGFIMLPDGSYYAVAVFVKDSAESPAATARIIADISKAVYDVVTR